MNFRKIYEKTNDITYEHGNNGPFDEWQHSLKNGKEIPPTIKGTPHFDLEQAKPGSTNLPSCPCAEDSYEARYSKTGSLTESEIRALKEADIDFEDDDFDEDYITNEDEFDEVIDPTTHDLEGFEIPDEEDLEDDEMREYSAWKFEQEDGDHEDDWASFEDGLDREVDEIPEYDENGEFDLDDTNDYLTDDEENSGLGKLNRGEDSF
jgi:hypothetical protein